MEDTGEKEIHLIKREINWVHGETQTQWMSIGGDRTCYYCGKWGHMARNCWEKNRARVVETPQESAKESRGQ